MGCVICWSEMEEVIENKKWMCPHCVEEKGVNPYWICNRFVCFSGNRPFSVWNSIKIDYWVFVVCFDWSVFAVHCAWRSARWLPQGLPFTEVTEFSVLVCEFDVLMFGWFIILLLFLCWSFCSSRNGIRICCTSVDGWAQASRFMLQISLSSLVFTSDKLWFLVMLKWM